MCCVAPSNRGRRAFCAVLVIDGPHISLWLAFATVVGCRAAVWCLQGSDADNIIPDEVVLRGTLRALTHAHMMFIKKRIEEVRATTTGSTTAAG